MLNVDVVARGGRNANSVFTFDLADVLEQAKRQGRWINGRWSSVPLVLEEGLCIALVALRDDATLLSRQAGGPVSLEVVQGQLRLSTDFETVDLEKGETAAWGPGIGHRIESMGECAFLLTVGGRQAYSPDIFKS